MGNMGMVENSRPRAPQIWPGDASHKNGYLKKAPIALLVEQIDMAGNCGMATFSPRVVPITIELERVLYMNQLIWGLNYTAYRNLMIIQYIET